MTPRPVSFVVLAALTTACAPSVRVPVLQPAMVEVPADIRTIGVIDRSAPANVGEGILGALEGAVTGEGIMADREGAAESLREVTFILQESPRFEVVTPNVTGAQANTGIFDNTLDFKTIKKICKEAGCDALLALEAFDSDSSLSVDGAPINPSTVYTDVTVQRDTRVLTAWRLYDADEDRVIDEIRGWDRSQTWDHYGATLDEALRELPTAQDTVRVVGGDMGADYGMRIAPTWVDVYRAYYGSGHPDLKEGKAYVKARDWDGAKEIWNELASNPDPKIAGKASFNLALAAEVEGDLRQALEHAKKAAVDLRNSRSRDYVWTIEQRIKDQAKLEAQLAPPPPDAIPEFHKPTTPDVTKPSPEPAPAPAPSGGQTNTMTRPQ